MKIKTDLHCHTIASTHAYSTVLEIVKKAADSGLEAVAITDHSPSMPDAPHPWHFECLNKCLPKEIMGVRVLSGCEVDILDKAGNLGLDDRNLSFLDVVIASVHTPTYKDLYSEDNTSAYLAALENKYVDILGHTGNPNCRFDIECVLKRAKELGKFIEINNNTFVIRPKNIEICREIALAAKRLGVGVVVNSDAHFALSVGEVADAMSILEGIDFPEKLIINRDFETFKRAMAPRKVL